MTIQIDLNAVYRVRVRATLLLIGGLLLLGGPRADAQQLSSAYSAGGNKDELEDVVVTARRRAEELTEVPGAVTAFTAKDIESIGVQQPADFLNLTPGVWYRNNTTPGTSFVNIRGITQSRNAESPVAVVVDGVFLNNPYALQNQFVDIQQIEVLKGPQGALYGRNASAGAIIITTEAPTDHYDGYMSAGIGRHQTYKAEGSFGGPLIGDTLEFRATVYARGTNGFLLNNYLSNTGPDGPRVYGDKEDDTGGRLRLLWKMTDTLKSDIIFAATTTSGGFNNDVFDPKNSSDQHYIDTLPWEPNVHNHADRTTYDASWRVTWDNPLGQLTSVTAYDKLNEAEGGDSLPYSSSPADGTQFQITDYTTYSQELRLTSLDAQRLRWAGGAYFQHTDRFFASSSGTDEGAGIYIIDATGATNGPNSVNPASGGILATAVKQNSWAVFGSLAYDLNEKLELSGAFRYDSDRESGKNVGPFGPGFSINPYLGTTRKLDFSKPQPKVTLRYKIGDNGNLYADYAEGFKNGGFNPQGSRATALMHDPNTAVQDFFNSESTKTFEIGYKNQFWNRRVTTNVAIYDNQIRGANYFDFIVVSATQENLNIDKVSVYGIEADVLAKVTDSLTVGASGSAVRNIIKQDAADPSAVGKRSPYFPNRMFDLSLQYEHPVTPDWRGFARLDYEHVGRLFWDLNQIVWRDPLDFVDARVGLQQSAPNGWRADIYCKNCTNLYYTNESLYLSQIGLTVHFPVRDARLYGVEFSKHF